METFLVGVDGSVASRRALEWAVAHAEIERAKIRVLMVVEGPTRDMWIPHSPLDDRLATARRHLAGMVKTLREYHPQVAIEHEAREGRAAQVLLEVARDCDLLVVGGRGRGGVTGALVGSVSLHCVAHSPCPVVVVRRQRKDSAIKARTKAKAKTG